jgi:hypothetical protein
MKGNDAFQRWWVDLSEAERKHLGEHKALFVWEEAQRHTLGTIEEIVKSNVAFDEGHKEGHRQGLEEGQRLWQVHLGGYTLMPGMQPGMIWIRSASGEGGDFHIHELAEAVHTFYQEKF